MNIWKEFDYYGWILNEDVKNFKPLKNRFFISDTCVQMIRSCIKLANKNFPLENRKPHYLEIHHQFHKYFENKKYNIINTGSYYEPLQPPFIEWKSLQNHTKLCLNLVNNIYRKTLKRNILEIELSFILQQILSKYQNLFCKYIEISKCVVCGKPIYASDAHKLDNQINFVLSHAGEINISFGYGSLRDSDQGKCYIHDYCSLNNLDQLFKNKIEWSGPFYYNLIKQKKNEEKRMFNNIEKDIKYANR